ncbi:glycoside hydrolase family 9 protein [Desertihabitans aurantiacus]|uniref:glycoside hydrolase family 9 protein n=1 Tax=Desertihabitans aurantiacus TaxID=2282477 RepID=UPI000DF8136E|nr:glycoside hydrolase family 9 protein [Desertihabitans aurantiacus]
MTHRARRSWPALLCSTAVVLATGLAAPPPAAAEEPVEQIRNGGFDDGLAGWNAYPNPAVVDGRGCVEVPAGSGPYSAALQQPVPLLAGETYRLEASMLSVPATQGNVRVVVQAGPDLNYREFLPTKKVPLTPEPQTHAWTFTPDTDYAEAQVTFQQDITNAEAYRLCVDDVSLTGGAEPEPYEPDTGPAVRVNQVGYLPEGPKRATVVSAEDRPQPWELRQDGVVVRRGSTAPAGLDPSAGVEVHTVDFSAVRRTGDGFTLRVGEEESHPFSIRADLWDPLRVDAKTFFYTNRSGIEISDAIAPGYGRAAGHVGVAPNQGDTAVPCQDPGDPSQLLYDEPWTCEGTRDVTGGWYDAGDHGKYMVPAGISVGTMLMEHERTLTADVVDEDALGDGTLRVPETGNGVPDILDEARWKLEWMLKMQVPQGQQYAGMTNHKVADVDWTGLPLDPAADPQRRVLYRPSTTGTLNLAAVAAQGSRLWAPYDEAFAEELLEAARTAYAAAQAHPDLLVPPPDAAVDPNPGSGPYDDADPSDEFYWAAAQLYLTTGERGYETDLTASPHHRRDSFTADGASWGEVASLGKLSLATVPNELRSRRTLQASVLRGADRYLAIQDGEPFGHPYAPTGGNYAWGSNGQVLNILMVLGYAYDLRGDQRYADGFLEGMDYLFGRNALNQSYVTGYGEVASKNMHSRMYANQLDPSSPNPPPGTVAGGANATTSTSGDPVTSALFPEGCAPQTCYVDDIGSYSTNELTINWQAPMGWVASFAADLGDGRP